MRSSRWERLPHSSRITCSKAWREVQIQIRIVGQRFDCGAQVGDRLAEAFGCRAQHGVALTEHRQFGRDILEGDDVAVDAVILLEDDAHLTFQ